MDDMMGKLQALLSDPEAMQNLQELSAMLKDSDAEDATPPECESSELPFDMAKLLAVSQAVSQTEDDKNITLLLALKPHLSEPRRERVDNAVKLLRLYSAASVLKEQGMLDELLAGF